MPKPRVRLNRAVSAAKFLLHLAAGGASIATVLGFAGSLWWVFELFDHPRPLYCLILVAAIVVGGISRQMASFAWCLPLLLNLVVIVPLFVSPAQDSSLASANRIHNSTLRLLLVNLDHQNQDTNPAIQYIESQSVDLVLLQEVTSKSLAQLESNLLRYQVATSLPQEDSIGVAMLVPITPSKSVEIVATQILELPPNTGQPLIETTLQWGSKEVVVLSLSIARPRNRDASAFQQVEFDATAQWSLRQQTKDEREVVVIGDFNTTPWSGRFRKFLQDSNLRNSLRGFGLQPTWHAALPSPFMIAIDHCLHSKLITTINRATGSNIGSDHLPLSVELRRGF